MVATPSTPLSQPTLTTRPPDGGRPLRSILIMGGHAAGKTTLFRWGQTRVGTGPGYSWHMEGHRSLSTMPVEQAYAQACKEWNDRSLHTVVIEGTRVYTTIFKVARDNYAIGRELWTLLLLQDPAIGRTHMRARCAARGKVYDAYWEREEAAYQFAERYTAAHRKFLPLPSGPHPRERRPWEPKLGEQLTIWVNADYSNLNPARTWFAAALGAPLIRTPVRLQEDAR